MSRPRPTPAPDRRSFLKGSVALVAAAGLPARFPV
jgi:hypothetical protein